MSALTPFMVLDKDCDGVLVQVWDQLGRAGLQMVKTFDLRVARLAHPDSPCPFHETDICDCQMVVLLLYDGLHSPVTLVIHGMGGRSWLSLVSGSGQGVNPPVELAIRHMLTPGIPSSPSSAEMLYEANAAI